MHPQLRSARCRRRSRRRASIVRALAFQRAAAAIRQITRIGSGTRHRSAVSDNCTSAACSRPRAAYVCPRGCSAVDRAAAAIVRAANRPYRIETARTCAAYSRFCPPGTRHCGGHLQSTAPQSLLTVVPQAPLHVGTRSRYCCPVAGLARWALAGAAAAGVSQGQAALPVTGGSSQQVPRRRCSSTEALPAAHAQLSVEPQPSGKAEPHWPL